MSDEQISLVDWLRFDIYPAENTRPGPTLPIMQDLTYAQLIRFWRDSYVGYTAMGNRIAQALGEPQEIEISIDDLLEDELRNMHGIPDKPQDVKEALFRILANLTLFSGDTENHDEEEILMDGQAPNIPEPSSSGRRAPTVERSTLQTVLTLQQTQKNNRVRWKKWTKSLLEDDLTPKQYEDIYVKVVTGFSEEFLGGPFFNGRAQDIFALLEAPEDYETADDDDIDLTLNQHDIVADALHTNVNLSKRHRHTCTVCDRQFAHTHGGDKINHPLTCDACSNYSERLISGQVVKGKTEVERNRIDIVPADFEDLDLYELTEDEVVEFRRRIAKAFVLNYYDSVFNDRILDEKSAFEHVKSAFVSSTCRSVLFGVTLFLAFKGIRSLFRSVSGEAEEERHVYFSQSHYKSAPTRTRPLRPRKFTDYMQQSSTPYVTIEIRGVPIVAMPLTGHTMMTYEHSMSTLGKEDHGESIVFEYKGVRESHTFGSLHMVTEPNSDLLFITLPRKTKMNSFPNMINRFWSDNDVATFEHCPVSLETMDATYQTTAKIIHNKSYVSSTRKRTLDLALGYQAPTKKGDCGGMLVSTYGNHCGRYLGMHVAGGAGAGGFFGMSTIITREMIAEALNFKGADIPEIDFFEQGVEFQGPNLHHIETIPRHEQVYLCRKTKLKPSIISDALPWDTQKHLPLMSADDERSDGQDPVVNMLNDTLSVEQPTGIDTRHLKMVRDDMIHSYRHALEWPIGRRMLTIEEALGGIPGLLTSLKVKTSPGYPLVLFSNKRGKKDWYHFDDKGDLVINPSFRKMVSDFLEKLTDPNCATEVRGRFLVYLKDELTTSSKIEQKRCRLIFGGDLIANTAFRMLFGSFIIAFQRSHRTTPSAIGLNQYSQDMELIYQYLIEVGENFIAGDFKNFDKKMVREFQMLGYEIITALCDFIPKHTLDKFVYHQTQSPLQVFNKLLYLKSSHFSGCFFTTILNILVHEAYIRYIFKTLCPGYIFEDHMRMKILGDDHIYSVSDEIKDKVTPLTIAKQLELLGQTYTSDDKLRPLDDEHREFSEITFLGAHPIEHDGKFVGALKKDTLHESLKWTRNHDNTIIQECRTAMELMSVWGPEDYDLYYRQVNTALYESGYDPIILPSQTTMIDIVASRTSATDCCFPMLMNAQGNDSLEFGLTKLNERHTLESTVLNNSNIKDSMSTKAMAETPMDLKFSTESNVWRDDFTWTASDPAGTAIYTIDVPFGLLSLGEASNIQNMPFDRYTYWTGDVEVSLQINGQPFQQGLLAMYFMPLASYQCELSNITTTNHVLLTPGESSTASLMIPFIYPRSLMNTYAGATESLGTVYITPLSPLQSMSGDILNVSVFSRFPNSTFRIPKVPIESMQKGIIMHSSPHGTHNQHMYKGKFLRKTRKGRSVSEHDDDDVIYEAQGAGQSTTVTNSYYNVGGSMPIQDNPISIGQEIGQQITADLEADVSAMPLDNPPLCSGSIPMHQTFSGMSASHGVRPTNDMQLFPSALSREPIQIFNPVESKISTLLGKKCLLTSFEVSSSDVIGKLLYSVQLNTRMGLIDGSGVPFNVALLNQFIFWRSHIRFEVVAVRTKFHSTRLNAVVTYGAPVASEALRTVAYSHMIDFSGENSKFDFDVEWNAQTEFLRTYEGEGQVDPVQNYSLGNLSIYLTNALVAPESVSPAHQVLVFVRFVEPRVAVPRPYSPFTFNAYSEIVPNFIVMTIADGDSVTNSQPGSGSKTTALFNKTNLAFNPIVPADGTYNSAGSMTLRYFSSLGGFQAFVVNVQQVTFSPTAATVSFSPTITVPAGFADTANASFESITILDSIVDDVKVKLFAQGPDIPPSNEDGTQPQDETVEAVPTTHEETATRPTQPCKLEIGRKFEFVVSDIHEIGRRYHRIKLVGNNDLDQFAVNTTVTNSGDTVTFVNFSVQVQSYLRAFFAVWAGSVKYRVFNIDDNIGNIVFVPYLNTDQKICVPVIDALKGEAFTYNGEALTSLSSVSAPMARERLYPVALKQFIDVSAPFQTHFNFCYNSKTQDIAPIASGTMAMSYGGQEPEIYTAFGDDLRLGVFRPPQATRLNFAGFKSGVAGFFNPVLIKNKQARFRKEPIKFEEEPNSGVDLVTKVAEPAADASGAQSQNSTGNGGGN
ncbi:MAG: RNA-dependent RNA polymerase [Guiyang picorna-like virus 2]|nr:MAG: RNA-dependent RNA polymerase [Guiyang picorna-like virus 2]